MTHNPKSVLVIGPDEKPRMPTTPSRARRWLQSGRASVYRRQPFTVILKDLAKLPPGAARIVRTVKSRKTKRSTNGALTPNVSGGASKAQ